MFLSRLRFVTLFVVATDDVKTTGPGAAQRTHLLSARTVDLCKASHSAFCSEFPSFDSPHLWLDFTSIHTQYWKIPPPVYYTLYNMPSELTNSVRSAITAFVANKTSDGEHLPADILRIVRDEASNLLERQLICDTLDADPYKLCEDDKDIRRQMKWFQQILNVVSCSRTKTLEGRVNFHCVVELSRDAKMNKNVRDCIRLEFTYDRSPVSYSDYCSGSSQGCLLDDDDDDGNASMATGTNTIGVKAHKGTRVMYSIDFSRDYGQKQRLITIEVMASGEAPSAEQAIPMEDDDDDNSKGDREEDDEDVWEDYDEDGEPEEESAEKMDAEDEKGAEATYKLKSENASKKTAANVMTTFVGDGKDRYAAYVDPESLYEFLSCTGLLFDEATTIYFLMTFPFFEHEWDLLGFLLDAVFGGDGGDDSGEEEASDEAGDDEG